MPKIEQIDWSKLPTIHKPKRVKKDNRKNWKIMNREVKPREVEILARLQELQRSTAVLNAETKKLNDELKSVRTGTEFGTNSVKLYALRLQNDCWYIGMTFDVERRFKKHFKGKGANWTKLNKPIEIHETRNTKFYSQEEVARLEDDMTLEYALKYGSDKVRGGGYCQAKPRWPGVITENEMVIMD